MSCVFPWSDAMALPWPQLHSLARLLRLQMASECLQKIRGRRQGTEAVFAHELPEHTEKADWFIFFGGRFGDSLRNCLEDRLKRLRLDAPQNLLPEEQVSDGTNGLRSARLIDDFFYDVVACCQRAARDFERAAVVQFLENRVSGQQGLSVLIRGLLQLIV